MRIRRALPALLALAAAATAAPAHAATTGGTLTTFVVAGSGLSITVPSNAALTPSGVPGGSITGAMGPVNVTDGRGLLTAAWTTTVSSTAFTTGGGTAPETVPASAVSYWSGPATATTGVGVFTPGQLTAILAQTLASSRTAFTLALGVGNNSATWDPSLIVAVPAAAVVGTYTGTVTHSVA